MRGGCRDDHPAKIMQYMCKQCMRRPPVPKQLSCMPALHLKPAPTARHPRAAVQAAPAGLTSLATWQAHQLEAWAAAFDHWNPSLIHSGGDDCAYRLWDSRQGFDAPTWQSSKVHGAGVCCVSSSPHREHLVCTGSYDDHLRLWDVRSPHRPLLQAEVGGQRAGGVLVGWPEGG